MILYSFLLFCYLLTGLFMATATVRRPLKRNTRYIHLVVILLWPFILLWLGLSTLAYITKNIPKRRDFNV